MAHPVNLNYSNLSPEEVDKFKGATKEEIVAQIQEGMSYQDLIHLALSLVVERDQAVDYAASILVRSIELSMTLFEALDEQKNETTE